MNGFKGFVLLTFTTLLSIVSLVWSLVLQFQK